MSETKKLGMLDAAAIVSFGAVIGLFGGGFLWAMAWRPETPVFNLTVKVTAVVVFLLGIAAGIHECRKKEND